MPRLLRLFGLRRLAGMRWGPALFVAGQLRDAWSRLTAEERREGVRLVRKYQGRRTNLSQREWDELKRILYKGAGR